MPNQAKLYDHTSNINLIIFMWIYRIYIFPLEDLRGLYSLQIDFPLKFGSERYLNK